MNRKDWHKIPIDTDIVLVCNDCTGEYEVIGRMQRTKDNIAIKFYYFDEEESRYLRFMHWDEREYWKPIEVKV